MRFVGSLLNAAFRIADLEPSHPCYPPDMKDADIAHELEKTGLCIAPHFLSVEQLNYLRQDLALLRSTEGAFQSAGVGKGTDAQVRTNVRLNEYAWLERETATLAQSKLWTMIDDLKQAFNRTLFLGLQDFEGQYTVYPRGGFYQRHLDTFAKDQKREVSLILYLNEDWKPADGGALRVYQKDQFIDIAPVGGTLVCFLSRELEHEVLPSHSERLSFTGWFRTS